MVTVFKILRMLTKVPFMGYFQEAREITLASFLFHVNLYLCSGWTCSDFPPSHPSEIVTQANF